MAEGELQTVRGMTDILPESCGLWQQMEQVARSTLASYGYSEMRMPLLEKTALFSRAIGEVTDVVEKEMYTFEDRSGESLTLRPEGTAGCVRACINHHLLDGQEQRLWYMGPMFRYERPQKGRSRQFHQLGVEAFGLSGPDIDAELIMITRALWRQLGVAEGLVLQLNTLGSSEERAAYRAALVNFLEDHAERLDDDSRRRIHTNPLRVLDSKHPEVQELLNSAPQLTGYLGTQTLAHFEGLQQLLQGVGIAYELNPRLVRGLDYYNHTVFEWVSNELGAQGTVCGGGRYDGLVGQLGGTPCPAAGFGVGLERLQLLLAAGGHGASRSVAEVYIMASCIDAPLHQARLAEWLHGALPELRIMNHCGGGNFRRQFRRADRSGARVGLILGDDELKAGTVGVKDLHDPGSAQQQLRREDLPGRIRGLLGLK